MNLIDIKDLIVEAALKAGLFIAEESKKFNTNSIEYKDINNLVSYVDKEAEKIIVEHLITYNSNFGFITEEDTKGTDNIEGYNFIIDPLDGTANFVHGLPHYAVSIALAKGKEILIGVIYNVPNKDLYWAVKGEGAFKNNIQIKVSEKSKLSESLLATGFPYYQFEEMSKYLKILEHLMKSTHGLRRFGSAALDLAFVAEGRYEGFFEYNLNSYDIAAGALLVTEAGGFVSDFEFEDNYLFKGDIIAGGEVFSEIQEVIKTYW